MLEVVVTDTSYLILLDKIDELDLLHNLYNLIIITPEIAQEFDENLPYWIKISSVNNKTYQKILEASLDNDLKGRKI